MTALPALVIAAAGTVVYVAALFGTRALTPELVRSLVAAAPRK
jgi:hypothetical protein